MSATVTLRDFIKKINGRIGVVRLHIEDTEHAAKVFRDELKDLQKEKKTLEAAIKQLEKVNG